MKIMGEDRIWDAVALGAAALAAIVVRQGLQHGWEYLTDEEPPTNPAARSVGWADALVWTIATGVAVGIGRLLAERTAAAGWKKVRGRYPKDLA